MRELHLFAGIGGGMLAGELLGHEPVCAVELEPFCRSLLAERWPGMPIHDDIRTFQGAEWRGRVDIVCGGFPCQDISSAGKRAGLEGERSGLWWEMHRVIREVGPRYVFVENVAAITFRGLDRVLGSLADLGFDAEWCVLSAAEVGAPHLRKRLWILAAHPDRRGREGVGLEEHAGLEGAQRHELDGLRAAGRRDGADVADAGRQVLEKRERASDRETARIGKSAARGCGSRGWWATEPDVGRVAHGIPARVDRLRGLGNAQVPLQAATAFRILMARLRA